MGSPEPILLRTDALTEVKGALAVALYAYVLLQTVVVNVNRFYNKVTYVLRVRSSRMIFTSDNSVMGLLEVPDRQVQFASRLRNFQSWLNLLIVKYGRANHKKDDVYTKWERWSELNHHPFITPP